MNELAAVIAANKVGRLESTVAALRSISEVDQIVVVADGSPEVERVANSLGVEVVRLRVNHGKGAALAAGVFAAHSRRYLLCDADLGESAVGLRAVIAPVMAGNADLAIAVFPAANGRAGAGRIKAWSREVILKATGTRFVEPLSGQRCVDGDWLRSVVLAPRFGVEVGVDLDAATAGLRIVEVPTELDHEHSGTSWRGVRHRVAQGTDIARTFAQRLVRGRLTLLACATLVIGILGLCWALSSPRQHDLAPLDTASAAPIVVTLEGVGFDEIRNSLDSPNGIALLTARTPSAPSDLATTFASLSAGGPAMVTPLGQNRTSENAGLAWGGDEAPSAEVRIERFGVQGAVSVAGHFRSDSQSTARHGALGDALQAASVGRLTLMSPRSPSAAALVLADSSERLGEIVQLDPSERQSALEGARPDTMVHIDLGDVSTLPIDDVRTELDALSAAAPLRPMVVVWLPPGPIWQLSAVEIRHVEASTVLWGGSSRRPGIVSLFDVAPTLVELVSGEPLPHARGAPVGLHALDGNLDAATVSLGDLSEIDERTNIRESIYAPVMVGWVAFQAFGYLAILMLRRRQPDRASRAGSLVAVATCAWIPATMLTRLAPLWWQQSGRHVLCSAALAVAIAWWAHRWHRYAFSPLIAVAGLTWVLAAINAASSGRIDELSLFGYTPLTGARFYGVGNMGFAIFMMSALIVGVAWIADSPTPMRGILGAGSLWAVTVALQAGPRWGADFGSVLAMVPLYVAVLWCAGRRRHGVVEWIRGFAMGGVLALAVAVVVVKASASTHVAGLASSGSGLAATIEGKLATSWRVLSISPIAIGAPVAVVAIAWWVWAHRERLLCGDRVWSVGVAAMCIAPILGGAVNDSGVVITGVCLAPMAALIHWMSVREALQCSLR